MQMPKKVLKILNLGGVKLQRAPLSKFIPTFYPNEVNWYVDSLTLLSQVSKKNKYIIPECA